MKQNETSWQNVSEWYGDAVGRKGHYYHQHIILPRSLKLLGLKKGSSLLDLACGQGVLARQIPKEVRYEGVDIAHNLIEQAASLDRNREHIYHVADIGKELPFQKNFFSHAAIILALQNVEDPEGVISNAQRHLKKYGKFLIVLNHPCFRIPRQTRWEIDEKSRIQYRRIDRYMTSLKVPISIHPGRGARSEITWSYHIPLSEYSRMLSIHGFVIEQLEEWISDKQSVGEAAKMENRARSEFPLFMAILARKDR
ncbi:MAG: methyltransferase domain-containing protein [Chloroflexota bacterium]